MSKPTVPMYATLEEANAALPVCPRPCYLCGPHGHHWYLWFPETDFEVGDPGQPEDDPDEEDDLEAIADPLRHTPDQEEPEDACGCICKHCPAKVYVHIDAEDLPEI